MLPQSEGKIGQAQICDKSKISRIRIGRRRNQEMNKKEVNEIRKQFSYENCTISRICGCYIDGEKQIQAKIKDAFLSLPEEEGHKYLDLMKKVLSGTVGKNLLTMDFPLESEMEEGAKELLLQLRDSKLEDDALLDRFYQKIMDSYVYGENYYIILTHAIYDVPGRSSSGDEMFDASDEMFEYITCAICPVKLSKDALSYDPKKGGFSDRNRDWIVDAPMNGFLFPAFTDRSTDLHSLLYYAKKPEELQELMIHDLFGCERPMSAGGQMDVFQQVILDTLEEDCDFETMKEIHETIYEMIEETKDEPDPLMLSANEVKKVLEQSGVSNEKMEQFDSNYQHIVEDEKTEFQATNLINTRQFSVATPDVSIKISPDRTDLIQTKEVDGRLCLVIEINDQIEVNGLPVKAREKKEISGEEENS